MGERTTSARSLRTETLRYSYKVRGKRYRPN